MNESDNIVKFPNFNIYNIPEALRKVANDLEDKPELCKHLVLCGNREDGVVWYKAFGADFTRVQAVGILEWGKLIIMGAVADDA